MSKYLVYYNIIKYIDGSEIVEAPTEEAARNLVADKLDEIHGSDPDVEDIDIGLVQELNDGE
jgi:hypothetical protein